MMGPVLERVVSGGQSGVDRAALDVAQQLGIPIGGWCPRGRRAEDGPIDLRYPLQETPTANYPQRTEWNVRDSSGTLIITFGRPRGGTALTVTLARRLGRPHLVVDLDAMPPPPAARATLWIRSQGLCVLNVAGPRQSDHPDVGRRAAAFLEEALRPLAGTPPRAPKALKTI
jgi:hypothetical protein